MALSNTAEWEWALASNKINYTKNYQDILVIFEHVRLTKTLESENQMFKEARIARGNTYKTQSPKRMALAPCRWIYHLFHLLVVLNQAVGKKRDVRS